jgi:hypothetical protein
VVQSKQEGGENDLAREVRLDSAGEAKGETMHRFSEHAVLRREEKKTKKGGVALDTGQPFMNRLGRAPVKSER